MCICVVYHDKVMLHTRVQRFELLKLMALYVRPFQLKYDRRAILQECRTFSLSQSE